MLLCKRGYKQAAKALSAQGLKLLATSRWRLPDWAEAEHYALAKPVFGDYVALVRLLNIDLKQQRLVDAFQIFGGNFRALLFFANAAKGMNLKEEQAFLATTQIYPLLPILNRFKKRVTTYP